MIELGQIFERVSRWNAARYEREYDQELSLNLLSEELMEYLDADTAVDQLDALCDTIYVAMGILWKLNLDDMTLEYNAAESHRQVEALITADSLEPIYLAVGVVTKYQHDRDYPAALAAQTIITLCFTQMAYMGLVGQSALKAMEVVCDSNDSKSVKKTKSNIKANAGDKGAYFVSPEPRLQLLLDEAEAAYNGH